MSLFDSQGLALAGSSMDDSDDQRQSSGSLNSNGDLMPPPSDLPAPPSSTEGNDSQQQQQQESTSTASGTSVVLDAHRDARRLVRLVQCQLCSLPLRQPLTMACGNSICRKCLPATHKRENITYPMMPGRAEAFVCPFADCGREHSLADSNHDVTLAKVLDRVSIEVARARPLTSNTPTLLEVFSDLPSPAQQNVFAIAKDPERQQQEPRPHSRTLSGGRLVATYTLAELGELAYDSDVAYSTLPPSHEDYQHLDTAMLEHLQETTRHELDCNLCYALLLDPVTTPCGHTYCRKCVARVLDHSHLCPECRRQLHMSPLALSSAPSNRRLSELLLALCAENVAARAAAVDAEEAEIAEQKWVPLFVCTLAYPQIPTFLHIFEPRYRLMIRRAMEADRMFGMLAYNAHGEVQGELGRTQFMRYGTMLEIVNLQLLEDGRSLIETRGVSRFCVEEHSMRDGYVIGRVSRVDDIPLAEEEEIERREVAAGLGTGMDMGAANSSQSAAAPRPQPSTQPALLRQSMTARTASDAAETPTDSEVVTPATSTESMSDSPLSASNLHSQPRSESSPSPPPQQQPPTASGSSRQSPRLSALPTSSLMRIGTDFIERMHASSASWLSHSSTAGYGAMPSDPAIFPYWFASVLPIEDTEKYRLLMERSVRGRLKICAEWVRRVERLRWFSGGSCTVL